MKRILLAALIVFFAAADWSPSFAQRPSDQAGVNRIWLPAHRGDRNAQYQLGLRYGSGNGIAKNMFEAAKWYRRAADQGHPKAQAMLGILFSSATEMESLAMTSTRNRSHHFSHSIFGGR